MPNYYEILGIQQNATSGQIKVAYRRLALLYHPDKNPNNKLAEKKFIQIAEAYDILSNPEKKYRYDHGLQIDINEDFEYKLRTRRPPPPHFYYKYRTEKITYSQRDYILATAAVIGIVLIAVFFPIYLLQVTSEKYFNKAIDMYMSGRYYSALHNVDLSIQDLSSTNSEACALASVILVHRLEKYDYALKYIDKGLDYDPNDSLSSEFHYLKGICFAKTEKPNLALKEFNQVGKYSSAYDSSLFRSAVILTFNTLKLDSAESLLNSLTARNFKNYRAHYLKGIIYEKKSEYDHAFEVFASLINTPFNKAASYYHLAKAEINLNLPDSACAHLEIASSYNLLEAKQLKNLYCKKDSTFRSPFD